MWRQARACHATKCRNFSGGFLRGTRVFGGGHYGGFAGQMVAEPIGLKKMKQSTKVFLGMEAVIASDPIRALLATIERVARSQATVLITGESGSGKELIARAVHHYSLRSHKPWVDLSCAALPD